MQITLKLGRRMYTSFLADESHDSIDSCSEIKRYDNPTMGLFFRGVAIGDGYIERWKGAGRYSNRPKDTSIVQTESTGLRKGMRKKGHGIALYICFIETARAIGATRIYSSKNLNKLSRRMWAQKLGRYYNVQVKQRNCECGRVDKKKPVYFIDLQGKTPDVISVQKKTGNR